MERDLPPEQLSEEPPPVLGSWPRVYAAVVVYLLILVVLLYLATRYFTV